MEINKKLDTDNDIDFLESGSLVHASNIIINADNNSIQNENAIHHYITLNKEETIVGHIACSNEFVIFTNKNRIIRYNEKEGTETEVTTNWNWEGGNVFGDYTYNVNNELIVAISERNSPNRVPLKSINLDVPNYDIYGDGNKYTLNPPIPIYNLKSYSFISGTNLIWNGTYVMFIRFFNNEYDYTHWFKLGNPIIVSNDVNVETLEDSYYIQKKSDGSRNTNRVVIKDVWTNDNDKNTNNIQLLINIFDKDDTYKYYQIGYVVTTIKHETIGIVERKVSIHDNIYIITNIQDDKYNISIDELTSTFFNLYNVNTLCNYNNRLYVADYIEENYNANVENIDTSKISVNFHHVSTIDTYAAVNSDTINVASNDVTTHNPVSANIDISSKSVTMDLPDIEYVWNNPDKVQLKSDFELDKKYKCYVQGKGTRTKAYLTDCSIYKIGLYNKIQISQYVVGVDMDFALVVSMKDYLKARGVLLNRTTNLEFVDPKKPINPTIYKTNIDDCYIAFTKTRVYRYKEDFFSEPIYAYKGNVINIPNFSDLKLTYPIFDYSEYDESTMSDIIMYQCDNDWNRLYGSTCGWYIDVYDITFNDNMLLDTYIPIPNRKYAIGDNVYNFYIHYVYDNGSYTDGIRINNNDTYNNRIYLGNTSDGTTIYYTADENTTIEDLKNYAKENNVSNTESSDVSKLFNTSIQNVYVCNVLPIYNSNNIAIYKNNKGEKFFRANSKRLEDSTDIVYGRFEFSNITMYKGFVGYFISYEETQPILCGRAIIGNLQINHINVETSDNYNVYYHDFQITGNTNFNYVLIGNPFKYNAFYTENLYGIGYYGGVPVVNSGFETEYNNSYDGLYSVVSKKINLPGNPYMGSPARVNVTLSKKIGINVPIPATSNDAKTIRYKRMALLYNYNNEIYTNTNKKLVSLGYITYDEYIESQKNIGRNYGALTDVNYNYDYYVYYDKYSSWASGINTNGEKFSGNLYSYKFGLINTEDCGLQLVDNNPYPVRGDTGESYYPSMPISRWTFNSYVNSYNFHIAKIGFPFVSKYLYSARTIKNKPITRAFTYYDQDDKGNWTWSTNITNINVQPDKVDDIFEINSAFYDYIDKVITNFNKDLYSNYVTHYQKTIRRSDVISDENVENNWKTFRAEEYKIIAENKGNIINITGIGNYLIAHCEHSMFMFNRDSSMKTENKDVQLTIPDAFDIDYVEVFTSTKGYAGMQVHDQFICSNYGYIFYDRDGRKLYRFNENSLEDITTGFKHLLSGEITDINFAIDERNMRMLCIGKTKDDDIERRFAISYSFLSKYWVSTHSYWYDYIFNTKDNVYFINNNTIDKFDFSKYNKYINLIDDDSNYFNNEFKIVEITDGGNNVLDTEIFPYSFIDVVFNNQGVDKVLNYISYIVNKNGNDNYSGDKMLIYTNCCFSDYIDIHEPKRSMRDYKHPYYRYGVWFMNWFKNVIKDINTIPPINRHNGKYNTINKQLTKLDNKLIVGKYFVVRFIFRDDNNKININDIQCY